MYHWPVKLSTVLTKKKAFLQQEQQKQTIGEYI